MGFIPIICPLHQAIVFPSSKGYFSIVLQGLGDITFIWSGLKKSMMLGSLETRLFSVMKNGIFASRTAIDINGGEILQVILGECSLSSASLADEAIYRRWDNRKEQFKYHLSS